MASTPGHVTARGPFRLSIGHAAANHCCSTNHDADATVASCTPASNACDGTSSTPADAAQYGLSFELNMILTGQIATLNEEVAGLRQEVQQTTAARDAATTELTANQQTLQQAQSDALAMTEKLKATEEKAAADANAMAQQLEAARQEAENLKAELEASTAKTQELQKSLEDAQAARKKSDEEKEEALKKLAEMQATKTEEPEVTTEPAPAQPDPNAPPTEAEPAPAEPAPAEPAAE